MNTSSVQLMKQGTVATMMCLLLAAGSHAATTQQDLTQSFQKPPNSAKPRVYWMWVMSLVNQDGITRDLEEMAAKGIGGVMIFDLSGSPGPMPQGPAFMNPAWRDNFKHALREADRLGLEVSVNLCSGWDAGAVKAQIDKDAHLKQSGIRTQTNAGVVSLSGEVSDLVTSAQASWTA